MCNCNPTHRVFLVIKWGLDYYNPTASFAMSNSMSSDHTIGVASGEGACIDDGPSSLHTEGAEEDTGYVHGIDNIPDLDHDMPCVLEGDFADDSDSSWHQSKEDYESESEDMSEPDSDDDFQYNLMVARFKMMFLCIKLEGWHSSTMLDTWINMTLWIVVMIRGCFSGMRKRMLFG
ncbi:hypothetical protein ACH5RR_006770 [Cinchona calisaya]|uniref:Uncharacterized protein n=1 Tax=Cinchona calisaya TaxID=153742 RepID=A0ABD3APV9_9GENT